MAYAGYRGYGPREELANLLMQQQGASPDAVARMAGQMAPAGVDGIGVAEQSARRKREIANLLTGQTLSRNATSIGTGLAQMGEAFLANRAMRKADAAESELAAQRGELMKAAIGGDMAALAQLDLGAAISQKNSDRDFTEGNRQFDAGIAQAQQFHGDEMGLKNQQFDELVRQFDVGQGNWQTEFGEGKRQFDATLDQSASQHADKMALGWGGLRSDEAIAQAKLDAANAGPDVSDEGTVRREYGSLTKGFRDVQDAYQRIKSTDPTTPAGQMSLVFQYMKMLDPGSTVREGEYANAENARSIPAGVANLYNKIIDGTPLTPDQVKDFQTQAQSLYNGALQGYDNLRTTYSNQVAPAYGMDAERVLPDFALPDLRYDPKEIIFQGQNGAGVPRAAAQDFINSISGGDATAAAAEIADFDSTFGPGTAEALLAQAGIDVPRPPEPRKYMVPR